MQRTRQSCYVDRMDRQVRRQWIYLKSYSTTFVARAFTAQLVASHKNMCLESIRIIMLVSLFLFNVYPFCGIPKMVISSIPSVIVPLRECWIPLKVTILKFWSDGFPHFEFWLLLLQNDYLIITICLLRIYLSPINFSIF